MKVTQGQKRDNEFINSKNNTIFNGKNLVITNNFTQAESELGNTFIASVGGVINGIIPTSDSFVVFSIDGIYSQIGIYKDKIYTPIIRTLYFNFDINYPISGEYLYNYKKELIVTFTDNNDTPKTLNLTTLPFELNYSLELYNYRKIILAEQFIPFKEPIIKLTKVIDSSGNLKVGAYYISLQYKLNDDSYTNFSDISNAIMIVKSGKGEDWIDYHGEPTGIITNKAMDLSLYNIDNNFTKFRLGIIFKSENNITAYTSNDITITDDYSITVSSLDTYTEIDITNILINSASFKSIGSLCKINKRLYTANLTEFDDINYQKYANNININWVYNNEVSLDGIKSSYKDELIIFDHKGFMPGEIYAFYIRFISTNNRKNSKIFNIAGRDPIASEINASINDEVLDIYPDAKKFHLENTCSIIDEPNGIGTMGYWQNENETYPNTDDFNSSTLTNGRDLRNKLVKHHKFPTTNYLIHNFLNKHIIGDFENTSESVYISFKNPTIIKNSELYELSIEFESTTLPKNTGSINNTSWKNTTSDELTITLTYDLTLKVIPIIFSGYSEIISELGLYILSESGAIISTINSNTCHYYPNDEKLNAISTINDVKIITLLPTQSIYIKGYGKVSNTCHDFGGEITGDVIGGYGEIPQIEGNTFGKILGIKVSNIQIPQEIKNNYSHFEILYAERTTNNMTVLGNSLTPDNIDDDDNISYHKFYSFDLLNNKPSLSPTHLTFDYKWTNSNTELEKNIINNDITIVGTDPNNNIFKVNGAKYILNSSSTTIPSNEYGAEYIYLDYEEKVGNINLTNNCKLHTSLKKNYLVTTLYSFKKNVYKSFMNQSLVRTGNLIEIDVANPDDIIQKDLIFGGDTYFNLHGITTCDYPYNGLVGDDRNQTNYLAYYLAPEYSINNIGFRDNNNNKNIFDVFYPKNNLIYPVYGSSASLNYANVSDACGTSYTGESSPHKFDSLFTKIVKALGQYENTKYRIYDLAEYYGYNKAYNGLNNIQPFIIFNPKDSFVTEFPHRIYRSIEQGSESLNINWRTILPIDYVESVKDRQEIVNIDTNGQDLLVEHRYGLFIYRFTNEINIGSDVVSSLGDADIFKNNPLEAIPNDVGYVGCQNKFGSIRTKIGNIIIDREQGKIFIYNNTIEEITKFGMRDWFSNNLQYNNNALITQAYLFGNGDYVLFDNGANILTGSNSETEPINTLLDNPFGGVGIFCVWDEKYERLIFTKRCADGDSFSLDYYPAIKSWQMFHDYIPTYMFSNRFGLFAINESSIYSMNTGDPGSFILNNSVVPTSVNSYVDVVFNKPFGISKRFNSLMWKTIVTSIANVTQNTKTFNSLYIFNYDSHSNNITLINKTFESGNVRFTGGLWKFNEFRDLLKTKDINIIDILQEDELIIKTIPEDKIANEWYDKLLFIDDFIIVRFIFNNTDGDSIKINDIFANVDKVIR